MESRDYLIKELHDLHATLPYLNIKYEFDVNDEMHIIEVTPIEFYEKDERYIIRQIALKEDFINKFPNEEILFMTENILVQIKHPLLILNTTELDVQEAEIIDGNAEKVLSDFNFFLDLMRKDATVGNIVYTKCKPTSVQLHNLGLENLYTFPKEKPKSSLERFFASRIKKENFIKNNSGSIPEFFFSNIVPW